MDWRTNPLTATLSSFQRTIYEICASIPQGRVTTYGDIAKVLACYASQIQTPDRDGTTTIHISAQAVGTALKRNPFAPYVPCHRVLKAGNPPTIGGFKGTTEFMGTNKNTIHPDIQAKISLLESEGIKFNPSFELITTNALMSIHDWNPRDMKKAASMYVSESTSHTGG